MSQSTISGSSDRAVLLQRGNDLAEFVQLFAELAVPVHECCDGFPDASELEGARLAVVSGRRLLEPGSPNLRSWPRTIAVVDDASKTLVTHLNRIGVSMVIRRPIHPRTLRLLLLHEIYRGPERRVRKRVLIGHAIRVRSGLFRPRALLLELSSTGARIEFAHPPKIGSRIKLLLGKDLTKGRPVTLQAKVVRCIRTPEKGDRRESEVGVMLLDAQRHARTIKAILDRFAHGPAKWTTAPATGQVSKGADSHLTPPPSVLPPTRPASETPSVVHSEIRAPSAQDREVDASESATAFGSDDVALDIALDAEVETDLASDVDDASIANPPEADHDSSSDRRRDARIPYESRVVALGEEAARVLVGRDLSAGGMRIVATPAVSIGDLLRVALHGGAQAEPLVVVARAERDDGDDGIILCFDELSPSQRDLLDEIIASGLPVHATTDEFDDASATVGESVVVAEMLETISPQSDAEIAAHLDSVFDTGESVEDVR